MSETAHTENLHILVNLGYSSCRYFGLMAHNLHFIMLGVFIYIDVLNSLLCLYVRFTAIIEFFNGLDHLTIQTGRLFIKCVIKYKLKVVYDIIIRI